MPTAKVTKNVSAAIGGGNVLCSTLISIKTKAWLYSFRYSVIVPNTVIEQIPFAIFFTVVHRYDFCYISIYLSGHNMTYKFVHVLCFLFVLYDCFEYLVCELRYYS